MPTDTLAIGIGNAHGYYQGEPDIRLDVLEEVATFTDLPFVLHGCTGMSEETIKEAIKLGVSKINFGTEIRYKYVEHYQEGLETLDHEAHSWKLSQYASTKLMDDVKHIIELSGSGWKSLKKANENGVSMLKKNILITNGRVLINDRLENVDVLVEDGKITQIASTINRSDVTHLDALIS